jgi:hypothetical protein
MNFFCTKKHCTDWIEESVENPSDIFILDLEAARVVARWLFGPGRMTP